MLSALPRHFDIAPTKGNLTVKPHQGKMQSLAELKPACHGRPGIPYGISLTYPGVLAARLVVKDELNQPYQAMVTFYLARVIQGLLVALLLWRAILFVLRDRTTLTPGVLTLLAVCLSPMFISQSFGVTSDSIVQLSAISAIFAALFWERLKNFDKGLFVLAGAIAGVTKPVIMPLLLGALLFGYLRARFLPAATPEEETDNRRYGRFAFFGGLTILVCTLLFLYFGQVKEVDYLSKRSGQDLSYNLKFLLSDWGRAFDILWQASMRHLSLDKMTSPIGWSNMVFSKATTAWWKLIVYSALAFDLLIAAIALAQRFRPSGASKFLKQRLLHFSFWAVILVGGALAFTLANALALYVHWTPKDSLGVRGLQNRYFLPFFALFLASMPIALGRGLRLSSDTSAQSGSDSPRALRSWGTAILTAALLCAAGIYPYLSRAMLDLISRYY